MFLCYKTYIFLESFIEKRLFFVSVRVLLSKEDGRSIFNVVALYDECCVRH